jgi:hypothetical protein
MLRLMSTDARNIARILASTLARHGVAALGMD